MSSAHCSGAQIGMEDELEPGVAHDAAAGDLPIQFLVARGPLFWRAAPMTIGASKSSTLAAIPECGTTACGGDPDRCPRIDSQRQTAGHDLPLR
jgi:hypothetical protein